MINVFLEVEIIMSEDNPNSTVKKRAKIVRSEDVSQSPDSCGKVDFTVGDGEEAVSIRFDAMEFIKVVEFVQDTKAPPENTPNFNSGGW